MAARSKPKTKPGIRKQSLSASSVIILAMAIITGLSLGGIALFKSGSQGTAGNNAPETRSSTTATTTVAKQVLYDVVNSYPHDPKAFLQGLVFHDGGFYESTGQYGKSTLRRVEFPSGKIMKSINLDDSIFAEGLALVGDRLVQLTWQTQKGFVYDRETFNLIREFTYKTEGWGLTYDGKELILSDGSDTLTYINPETFEPSRKLAVKWNGRPVRDINELEFIEGEIWANIWHRDQIIRIDPSNGNVTSFLDLKGILPPEERRDPEAVLNGIAYDAEGKRIFISGKLWPKIFEIRLK